MLYAIVDTPVTDGSPGVVFHEEEKDFPPNTVTDPRLVPVECMFIFWPSFPKALPEGITKEEILHAAACRLRSGWDKNDGLCQKLRETYRKLEAAPNVDREIREGIDNMMLCNPKRIMRALERYYTLGLTDKECSSKKAA